MRIAVAVVLACLCLVVAAAGAPEAPRGGFAVYEVVIDSGDAELTAWQFELTYDRKAVAIVGLEGGGSAAFPSDRPPFYDPAGLRAGRVKVAAFTTRKDGLPTGASVVARLHVRVAGDARFAPGLELTAAARPGGKRIPAKIAIRKAEIPPSPPLEKGGAKKERDEEGDVR